MKLVSNTGRSVLLLSLIAALGGTASAQTTSTTSTAVTLVPGAWATTIQSTINGKNVTEVLKKVQTQLVSTLPAGVKESTIAKLNTAQTRVQATTCLTSQTAAALSTPAALFKSMSQLNRQCVFKAGRLTSTTQHFTGTCFDPMSFIGNVSGKVIVDGPTAWRTTFSGTGQVPDLVLQALALPAGTAVQMQTSSTSRLSASTCPATTTTVASAS